MDSFYLDEDDSVLVGEMPRARGFDVLTTRDAKNLGATDEEQLRFAMLSGRVFVTHNRVDFERLAVRLFEEVFAAEIASSYPGIIIAVRRPPRELTLKILSVITKTGVSITNQIIYI